MDIQPGQGYKAYRKEIVNPKPKYHLYLSDDIVFLINSKHNLFNFSIPLNEKDCPILSKECYLQVNNIYRYDVTCPIIEIGDMSDCALIALKQYLTAKSITKSIPKMFVDRAIGILTTCLEERKNKSDKS